MTTISHLQSKVKTSAANKQRSFLYLPWVNNKRQPNKNFVLNCDSQEWKLPEYNSLNDKNLWFYFANPNIRSVLRRNGVVDEHGNITHDKKRTVFLARQKLPPIKEGVEPNVQRLVAPYRNKKSKETLSKLSKYPSAPHAPQKRVSLIEQYNLAPKKSQTLLLKPKVLASTRKVQPLTKEQLEQVFAKYQIKTVSKKDKVDNESMTAEERSTDCKDRKSESSPEKVQPQNEIPQDFAVKKLDFIEATPERHEKEGEMKVNDDAHEEMVVAEPAVPLAPDHVEESKENDDKVEPREKEEEEDFIQIIENEKAIENVEEPEDQRDEEENEVDQSFREDEEDEDLDALDDKNPVEVDEKEQEMEVARKSDVYEKKHTTTPIVLPDSPEQKEEEEDNRMVRSNVMKESQKVNDSDLDEYNLSLMDEM